MATPLRYLLGGTRGSLTVAQLNVWTDADKKGWNIPLQHPQKPRPEGVTLRRQLTHFIALACISHKSLEICD